MNEAIITGFVACFLKFMENVSKKDVIVIELSAYIMSPITSSEIISNLEFMYVCHVIMIHDSNIKFTLMHDYCATSLH